MSEEQYSYSNAPQELREVVLSILEDYRDKKAVELDVFLPAIWTQCRQVSESNPTWQDIADVVARAFELDTSQIILSDLKPEEPSEIHEKCGWKEFEQTILFQIADLQRMRGGALDNELRYFGVQSPTENTWYNFDSLGFLECGLAGISDGFGKFQFESNWGSFQLFLEYGRLYE